eukprot:TRINITY_DN4315_c1_g2_i4.p2 TRINITY_DN4315_c1_g2~~TRINITY_DN4315_c1_g2_i4.p2  ORF type:complete len:392 (+),score=140.09 TRINITY_DN4315_c1_g2_i4:497-1672(+)
MKEAQPADPQPAGNSAALPTLLPTLASMGTMATPPPPCAAAVAECDSDNWSTDSESESARPSRKELKRPGGPNSPDVPNLAVCEGDASNPLMPSAVAEAEPPQMPAAAAIASQPTSAAATPRVVALAQPTPREAARQVEEGMEDMVSLYAESLPNPSRETSVMLSESRSPSVSPPHAAVVKHRVDRPPLPPAGKADDPRLPSVCTVSTDAAATDGHGHAKDRTEQDDCSTSELSTAATSRVSGTYYTKEHMLKMLPQYAQRHEQRQGEPAQPPGVAFNAELFATMLNSIPPPQTAREHIAPLSAAATPRDHLVHKIASIESNIHAMQTQSLGFLFAMEQQMQTMRTDLAQLKHLSELPDEDLFLAPTATPLPTPGRVPAPAPAAPNAVAHP